MKKAPKAKKTSVKATRKTSGVRKSTAAKKQKELDKLNLSDGKLEVEKSKRARSYAWRRSNEYFQNQQS